MARVFGPDNATLTVRTKRTGAASKAGHDLLIEVGSWSATLDPDADPALTLTADSRSLRVVEGTGGIQALDDEAKAGIAQTIDEEVLVGHADRVPLDLRRGGAGSTGSSSLRGSAIRSASSSRPATTDGSRAARPSGRATGG